MITRDSDNVMGMTDHFLNVFLLSSPTNFSTKEIKIDIKEVFQASPTIYTLLLCLSSLAVMIYLYAYFSSRSKQLMPSYDISLLRQAISEKKLSLALELCETKPTVFSKMIRAGIENRPFGHQIMIDSIKETGKRETATLWQKVSLLNDIAIIAPMLGLLGTVSGMFYAFYDLGRSLESLGSLFDGLGVSVGTTLAGLIVAILAMILCTLLKYRLTKSCNGVEQTVLLEAMRLVHESHS
jgi:biopolymer transport protein ExbB